MANPLGTNNSISKRLDKLLELYESKAAAIRIVMAELNDAATYVKRNGHATVIEQALTLDATRRTTKPERKRTWHGKAALLAQRRRSAEFLASMNPKVPQRIRPGFAMLISRGYLRQKGVDPGGYKLYVPTKKIYHIGPRQKQTETTETT